MARMTWAEKLHARKEVEVVTLDKPFGGSEAGATMLVASPMVVKEYIEAIPAGQTKSVPLMREELAVAHCAETTCPLTSGIFARIVAEAALDELREGKAETQITPFWRLIDPKSPLAKKLSCGPEYIAQKRQSEL